MDPSTAVVPLIIVLFASLAREAYEDYSRHKSDLEINSGPASIFKNGSFIDSRSQDIVVGEIVLVKENQSLPADLVLISTSREDGSCYL